MNKSILKTIMQRMMNKNNNSFGTSISLLLLLITTLLNMKAAPAWMLPCDFPAIYNFGDSNSDTGGISAAFWPTPQPNGVTFFGKPAGRSSDGRLILDFIAEQLGVPYLSPYLDSIGTSFRHGANFATGGSSIRRQNESIFQNGFSPFSLDIQTSQFTQFKSRTNELYNQARNPFEKRKLPKPKEFSRALYTLDIGQNDLASGFGKLTMPELRASIPDIIDQFATAVIRLYQQGARSFWIHNTGPIGCLPASTFYVRNPGPGFFNKYGCIRSHNAIALEFNKQLKARLVPLRREISHAVLTYVDIYSAKYHLITHSTNYGFKNPSEICCGHHKNDVHVWCGQSVVINGSKIVGSACRSPGKSISWDGVHYSEAANQWIAKYILNGSFSDPPKPITHACVKH